MKGAESQAPWVLCAGGRVVPLAAGSHVIGRADSDIAFNDDPKLSRRHARLLVSEHAVEIEDLGSTNGTWVDSYLVQHRLRVTRASTLHFGDIDASLAPAGEPRPRAYDSPTWVDEAAASERSRETTQQAGGLEYVKGALEHMLESGDFEQAKRTLDPVLATVEITTRTLADGTLETASNLALRLAIARRDASYVDTMVRMHCAHSAEMSDACLELLTRCTMAGLEPDLRNAEAYLALLGEGIDEATATTRRRRVEAALAAPAVTVPAPAPAPSRRE